MPDQYDVIGRSTTQAPTDDPLLRRVRTLYMDTETLLMALQGDAVIGIAGLPAKFRTGNCGYDYSRRAIFVHIHSPEYDEIPKRTIPPEIDAAFGLRYRREVGWFAGEMEKKLAKHDHDRDGWLGVPATDLFRLMGEHEAKLLGSVVEGDHEKIISAAADVANYCLMIADNALWDKAIREAEDQHGQPATDQAPR